MCVLVCLSAITRVKRKQRCFWVSPARNDNFPILSFSSSSVGPHSPSGRIFLLNDDPLISTSTLSLWFRSCSYQPCYLSRFWLWFYFDTISTSFSFLFVLYFFLLIGPEICFFILSRAEIFDSFSVVFLLPVKSYLDLLPKFLFNLLGFGWCGGG